MKNLPYFNEFSESLFEFEVFQELDKHQEDEVVIYKSIQEGKKILNEQDSSAMFDWQVIVRGLLDSESQAFTLLQEQLITALHHHNYRPIIMVQWQEHVEGALRKSVTSLIHPDHIKESITKHRGLLKNSLRPSYREWIGFYDIWNGTKLKYQYQFDFEEMIVAKRDIDFFPSTELEERFPKI